MPIDDPGVGRGDCGVFGGCMGKFGEGISVEAEIAYFFLEAFAILLKSSASLIQ